MTGIQNFVIRKRIYFQNIDTTSKNSYDFYLSIQQLVWWSQNKLLKKIMSVIVNIHKYIHMHIYVNIKQ